MIFLLCPLEIVKVEFLLLCRWGAVGPGPEGHGLTAVSVVPWRINPGDLEFFLCHSYSCTRSLFPYLNNTKHMIYEKKKKGGIPDLGLGHKRHLLQLQRLKSSDHKFSFRICFPVFFYNALRLQEHRSDQKCAKISNDILRPATHVLEGR